MSETQKRQGSFIAIITMFFLYAMISFVTNLAAPIGVIWKNQPEIGGSNLLGMMGNFMNFFAYLFMGIPAGKFLTKIGYKKTALLGIGVGFIGVLIQYLSGMGTGLTGFYIYLLGAFVSGFSVCLLNTVVNPMLNLIGGGGNRGNQLNLIGGSLNSLSGTLTPMFVGALIGTVTASTQMADINLVLYIAMAVFAGAFIALLFIPIEDPEIGKVTSATKFEHSPWSFRHCVLGVVAIFVYVGVEIGIPGTLNFYIADKVSSKVLMLCTSGAGMVLVLLAMISPKTMTASMPLFTGSSFEMTVVPLSALFLVLCGLCTSVMWASIFNLATEGLGKYTAQASGIFMMMVVGGGVLPLIQNFIADNAGYMISYIVPLVALAYMFWYALLGSKNVNKDIPVD